MKAKIYDGHIQDSSLSLSALGGKSKLSALMDLWLEVEVSDLFAECRVALDSFSRGQTSTLHHSPNS